MHRANVPAQRAWLPRCQMTRLWITDLSKSMASTSVSRSLRVGHHLCVCVHILPHEPTGPPQVAAIWVPPLNSQHASVCRRELDVCMHRRGTEYEMSHLWVCFHSNCGGSSEVKGVLYKKVNVSVERAETDETTRGAVGWTRASAVLFLCCQQGTLFSKILTWCWVPVTSTVALLLTHQYHRMLRMGGL